MGGLISSRIVVKINSRKSQLIWEKSYRCYSHWAIAIFVLKEFLNEIWQNHHDPTHAAYGIGGLIVLFIIYNRLLNISNIAPEAAWASGS